MSKLQLLAKLFLWFVFPAGRKELGGESSSHTAESVRACIAAQTLHLLWFFSVPRWAEVTVTWGRKERRANLLSSSQYVQVYSNNLQQTCWVILRLLYCCVTLFHSSWLLQLKLTPWPTSLESCSIQFRLEPKHWLKSSCVSSRCICTTTTTTTDSHIFNHMHTHSLWDGTSTIRQCAAINNPLNLRSEAPCGSNFPPFPHCLWILYAAL